MRLARVSPLELLVRARAHSLSQTLEEDGIVSPWYSRIDIYPHQLDTAIFATRKRPCRVLIADEVGLGKTIEAGLILKELILRNECNRAVLICPASLVSQWESELMSKFRIDVEVITANNVTSMKGEDHGVFLLSADLARRHLELFKQTRWDFALFDEAHHLRRHHTQGEHGRATQKYQLAEIVSSNSVNLVLLTATPMQLDYFEFYSLIRLIDDSLFPGYGAFRDYVEYVLADLRTNMARLQRGEEIDRARLADLIRTASNILRLGAQDDEIQKATTKELTDSLEKYDIIGDVMVRHRKREEFPSLKPRSVDTYPVRYSDEELRLYNEISSFFRSEYVRANDAGDRSAAFMVVTLQQLLSSSPRALSSTLRTWTAKTEITEGLAPTAEDFDIADNDSDLPCDLTTGDTERIRSREALRGFLARIDAIKTDSKLDALKRLVGELLRGRADEKVIVFTRFLETQRHLQEALSKDYRIAIFNGSMSLKEKDLAIDEFRRNAQVLISTEAGGEGRNMQFCHLMVNYDLPWNPVKLEQRIGRIDRIGQSKPIVIMNLASFDTIEQEIVNRLYDRINAFTTIVGPVDPVLGSIEKDIEKMVMKGARSVDTIDEFEERLNGKVETSKAAHGNLNLVLPSSHGSKQRLSMLPTAMSTILGEDMERFLMDAVRLIPNSTVEFVEPHIYRIRSGLFAEYSAGLEPTYTGTTMRGLAVADSTIDFFTVDHPLVRCIVQHYSDGESVVVSRQRGDGEGPAALLGFSITCNEDGTSRIIPILVDEEPKMMTQRQLFMLRPTEAVDLGDVEVGAGEMMNDSRITESRSHLKNIVGENCEEPVLRYYMHMSFHK